MDQGQEVEDELVATIPIHMTNSLSPNLHLYQFPLLSRPLEVPPSARTSGKRIKARAKPEVGRYEVHVPVDARPEVWNTERGRDYGGAREEEDADERKMWDGDVPGEKKGKGKKGKSRKMDLSDDDEDPEKKAKRLGEVRLKSEKVANKGDYFVGVVADGKLYLHPVADAQQFRPTLSYLDVLAKRSKPMVGDDDEDEDESVAVAGPPAKPAAREVVVSARGPAGEGAGNVGGLSLLRREMIKTMRKEQEEKWVDMEWYDEESPEAEEAYQSLFTAEETSLKLSSNMGQILTGIKGLSS